MTDKKILKIAIDESRESAHDGGFPVGAVIIKDGKIISKGISNGKRLNDPTSHAEVSAIRIACEKLKTRDLIGAVLYTTLEPCKMSSFLSSLDKS